MIKRPATPDGYGAIRADEVLPLREVARRLGWGQRTIRRAQADGLPVVNYGRLKYVRGSDVLNFFARLADADDADEGDK